MNEYRKELHTESRDNTGNYCYALYEFYTKRYDEAFKYLSKIKYDEHYLKIDVKILQLMLYFEMEQEDAFASSLESFRQFLANNNLIPQKRKIIFQNFQKYISKIESLKYNYDSVKKQMLVEKIIKDRSSINKKWLLEKINILR
jgi:hypothetical protein